MSIPKANLVKFFYEPLCFGVEVRGGVSEFGGARFPPSTVCDRLKSCYMCGLLMQHGDWVLRVGVRIDFFWL